MAHVLHLRRAAARTQSPLLHLGATSCYVGDNTDIILMREALEQIRSLLVNVIQRAGGLCRDAQGAAHARLHAFSGRTADDRRQARHALGAGSADGSTSSSSSSWSISSSSAARARPARAQASSPCSTATSTRSSRSSRRSARRWAFPAHTPSAVRPIRARWNFQVLQVLVRHRAERGEVLERHPAAVPPQGGGRAL